MADKNLTLASNDDNEITEAVERLYGTVQGILNEARAKTWRAVNNAQVTMYWEMRRAIVEEEQKGQQRAEYGKSLLAGLSKRLTETFGRGYAERNIWYMRNFFLTFPILHALRAELTWTHYRLLLTVKNERARAYYINEAIKANWSTRQLERQINSSLYERLLQSKDKETVLAAANESDPDAQTPALFSPADLIKDPYVLEFLGLSETPGSYLEADLETALLAKLEQFLLELGTGFAFMGRQTRIRLDNENFYIDLVFYHRLARCFVLIDLKTGKLTHQDLGQMQMYVHYYQRELMADGENPPIGLVLCADKSEAVVKYTLPENNTQIFASRYRLHLPTEEELAREIMREKEIFEREQRLALAAEM